MAMSGAERVAAHRERQRQEQSEVERKAVRDAHLIEQAKALVPQPGDRQDRAVAYAIWKQDAYEAGDCAHPYS